MRVTFDPAKNAANRLKHGLDLSEAATALFDPKAIIREDVDAAGEQRLCAVGLDARGRVLTLIYTYREPDIIRLISARRATKRERQAYES